MIDPSISVAASYHGMDQPPPPAWDPPYIDSLPKRYRANSIAIIRKAGGSEEKTTHSGTSTERDFVEEPSQMLEHWCWDRDVLKRISRHYRTGEPLPDGLIDAMVVDDGDPDPPPAEIPTLATATLMEGRHGRAAVAKTARRLGPVHHRQLHGHEDDIDARFRERGQRRLAVGREHDVAAGALQE